MLSMPALDVNNVLIGAAFLVMITISLTFIFRKNLFMQPCLSIGRSYNRPILNKLEEYEYYEVWHELEPPVGRRVVSLAKNDHSGQMSSKGKTPWMLYNDHAIADSQLCIEFLKEERDVDVDKHLSQEERAIARALRELTEENMYWTMCYETFVKNPGSLDILLKDVFPRVKTFLFKTVMGWIIKKELWGHGIGRHTDSEIWDIGRRDLTAISDYLGNKAFLMGDDPCELDCAVFGMLAMVVWQMRGSRHEEFVHGKLPNLVRYCERMRDRFWPDWTERCKGSKYVDDAQKIYTY